MSICGQYSLVQNLIDTRRAITLKCRSWKCETCNPKRKKRLIAQLIDGEPNKFLTLTVRKGWNGTPEEARKHLWWCWRIIVKRLKRRYKLQHLPYAAITEATLKGEPHFHIFLRSPYFPQWLISNWMLELANSPNVDIRAIDNKGRAVAYACKYGGKAAHRFNKFKRYFMTQDYKLHWDTNRDKDGWRHGTWEVVRLPIWELRHAWSGTGWFFHGFIDDGLEFRRC